MNKVFIIAGPSGVGKNYIVSEALKFFKNSTGIPTYTTRPAREDDKKSKSRIAITEDQFNEMLKKGEFIEHNEFNGYFYGKKQVDFENASGSNQIVIIEVDVHGLDKYRHEFGQNLTTIFICYESLDALKHRIKSNRPDATDEDILARSKIAIEEMEQKDRYDYVVTNIENQPEIALKRVLEIIQSKI